MQDARETSPLSTDPAPPPAEPTMGARLFLSLLFGWLLLLAGGYALSWPIFQLMEYSGFALPRPLWALSILGLGTLAGGPALSFVGGMGEGRYRALYQSWAWGGLYVIFMAAPRLLPEIAVQEAMLAQIALSLLFGALLLGWLSWRGRSLPKGRPLSLLPALALLPIPLYPWLLWGVLGSPFDLFLHLLVGLTFGGVVGIIAGGVLFPGLTARTQGPGWDFALGGAALGILLAIMALGFGLGGMAILLLFTLPPLGWIAWGLGRWGLTEGDQFNWGALALFVGLVAGLAAALVDPDELLVVALVSGRETFYWGMLATGLTLLVGWLGGILLFFLRRLLATSSSSSPLLLGVGGATWFLAALLYLTMGQPGFYGDTLFVVMQTQADLSAAPAIEGREARLRFVYDTLVAHADQSQADLRRTLEQMGVAYQPYYLVNAIEVEGGLPMRLYLESRPEVARVLHNPVLRPLPADLTVTTGSAEPPGDLLWNLDAIGAPQVWEEFGVRGEGIVIGQSDSGVQWDHPEFRGRYRGRDGNHDYDWYDPWSHSREPVDLGGHGTHTLGSILGAQVGVAPDASWFGCANLLRFLGSPTLYLDCMQFMLAPFPLDGDPLRDGDPFLAAHVLNNSWGCPEVEGCDPESLRPAVEALRAAGIFVVASAGNEGLGGCSTIDDPIAIYDASFSVGALDPGGNLAVFSSLGPVTADGSGRIKPDIIAPGVEVLSAFPNNSYEVAEGTSMAGPHVAGVVALMWSANPALIGDIERTEQLLIESARPYEGRYPECIDDPSIVPNNAVGYGIVDAYEAVRLSLEAAR